jgi:hypothetical protein
LSTASSKTRHNGTLRITAVNKRGGVNREPREFDRLREANGLNHGGLSSHPGHARFELENGPRNANTGECLGYGREVRQEGCQQNKTAESSRLESWLPASRQFRTRVSIY